ncbi:MAG: hypothetical protein FWG02_05380 [Holophagaceae bacterium]|nr:hypothetical protein [Holophagaceae bacterium]
MRLTFFLSLIFLATLPACVVHNDKQVIYAPTHYGITFLYENPGFEGEAQNNNRVQIRVLQSKETSEGLEVTCQSTSYRGVENAISLCQPDGAVFSVSPSGNKSMVLPAGFPEKTTSWESEGIFYQVIGRTKVDIPGVRAPDHIGVWVEAIHTSSYPLALGFEKARFFFLPNIGMAEIKVFSQGNWVTVYKLTGRYASDM